MQFSYGGKDRRIKILEGTGTMYTAFVDLEKAYDRVPREVLYWCLRKRGVSEKMVSSDDRATCSLYEGGETIVQCSAGGTEPFPSCSCRTS